MSTPKQDLTRLMAECFMEAADPDGGYEYAIEFAKSEINTMSSIEIAEFLESIKDGYTLKYDPDYCYFIIEEEE